MSITWFSLPAWTVCGLLFHPSIRSNPIANPAFQSPLEQLLHIRRSTGKLPVNVSDVEFNMPRPLYTINTLHHLQQQEPGVNFILVIGSDNLERLEAWMAGNPF